MAAHAVFTATHYYCLKTDLHIKHQKNKKTNQKQNHPLPPKKKTPTLSHPQQKLPGTTSDLKKCFLSRKHL
jgi:hypothetical protein